MSSRNQPEYVFDTEFREAGHHFPVWPISIGMVSLDGERELYFEHSDWWVYRHQFSDWLIDNVVPNLTHKPRTEDLQEFFRPSPQPKGQESSEYFQSTPETWACGCTGGGFVRAADCPALDCYQMGARVSEFLRLDQGDQPILWADWASYDWVVLCQLYGSMIQLPKGMPYWCRDIQQYRYNLGNPKMPEQPKEGEHHALVDARFGRAKLLWLREFQERLVPKLR